MDTVVIFALVLIKDETYDHVTAGRMKSGNLLIIIINIICVILILRKVLLKKLDVVGPVDNRPSSDKLHHIVKKKKKL